MKKTICIIIVLCLLVGCQDKEELIENYETSIQKLEDELELQVEENKVIKEEAISTNLKLKDLEILKLEQEAELEVLKNQVIELENSELVIPETSNWKYQEASGLRKYIGETGLRLYPSEDAPLVYGSGAFGDGNDTVFCRAVVTVPHSESSGHDGRAWGIVLVNNYGQTKVGYVPYDELEVIESEKLDYIEALSSFQLGDRIEKMIGTLDQDYEIKSENLCMYFFYDEPNEGTEPINYSGPTIEAFVSEDFRIWYLRTDSPKYELESGFKVGDNAMEVLDYYREHYSEEEADFYFPAGEYTFRVSDYEFVGFSIGYEELTEESVITWIGLY